MTIRKMIIEFPLSGEWYVGADGTEEGHELALDFMRLDHDNKATTHPSWRELFCSIPLEDYYGWGQPIFSPFAGTVIKAVDGWNELTDSYLKLLFSSICQSLSKDEKNRIQALKNSQQGDIRPFAGNYLVIQSIDYPEVYAFIAHARNGSIIVKEGDVVQALQEVAQVGHSGQSMVPHLHFHLMSDSNPLSEKLIPFVFREYEVKRDARWIVSQDTLPSKKQIIRRTIPEFSP